MSKLNIVLLVALVIQVGYLALGKHGNEVTGTSLKEAGVAGRQPYAGLMLDQVREITLTAADKPALRIVSQTVKEGDTTKTTWVLADRDNHAAKSSEAEKTIDTLRRAKFSRVLSGQSKRWAGLGVGEANASVHCIVKGDGGKILADVYLGDSRQANTTHFRIAGDDNVYAAADVNTWSFGVEASAWVDASWMDLPVDKVTRIRMVSEGKTIELKKELPSTLPITAPAEMIATWKVTEGGDGHAVDTTKVETWLRGLCQLSIADPIGKTRKPEYGFESPLSSVTIVTEDGKETMILVGAERKPQGDYYATATGREFVVTLRSWTVTDHFKKKFEDLDVTPAGGGGHEGHDHKD